jgi:VanZ family protein
VFGFAITDEYHQTFVSGRTGRPLDVIIDSAGALIGMMFYTTYYIVYKIGVKRGSKNEREEKLVHNEIED